VCVFEGIEGRGVGDDPLSYSFEGSRARKFHKRDFVKF